MDEAELLELVRSEGGLARLETLVRQLTAIERQGTGSPEGVVAAPPGTTYRNRSGGAGTTLYVKESGTGDTGWVGK